MRTKMRNHRKDSAMFSKTARITRAINLNPGMHRGGYRF